MPLYEYKCRACGVISESLVKTWTGTLVKCPECGAGTCDRIITAPGGYNIKGNNGASAKPKSAGSFKNGRKRK